MKVGDLVKYDPYTQKWAVGLELVGLVVETDLLGAERKDVKILWNGGLTTLNKSSRMGVIK